MSETDPPATLCLTGKGLDYSCFDDLQAPVAVVIHDPRVEEYLELLATFRYFESVHEFQYHRRSGLQPRHLECHVLLAGLECQSLFTFE